MWNFNKLTANKCTVNHKSTVKLREIQGIERELFINLVWKGKKFSSSKITFPYCRKKIWTRFWGKIWIGIFMLTGWVLDEFVKNANSVGSHVRMWFHAIFNQVIMQLIKILCRFYSNLFDRRSFRIFLVYGRISII